MLEFDLVESPVSGFERGLEIYDIYRPVGYKTPADLMVRFGRSSVRLVHFCQTELGRTALEQLFQPQHRSSTVEASRRFRALVTATAQYWEMHLADDEPATLHCHIRTSRGGKAYHVKFGQGPWNIYDQDVLRDGPIADVLARWRDVNNSSTPSSSLLGQSVSDAGGQSYCTSADVDWPLPSCDLSPPCDHQTIHSVQARCATASGPRSLKTVAPKELPLFETVTSEPSTHEKPEYSACIIRPTAKLSLDENDAVLHRASREPLALKESLRSFWALLKVKARCTHRK